MAGEYRGCDMFSDPCRRHNRYGICTGTSRISGDRTGTEIVPVLFVYTMSETTRLHRVMWSVYFLCGQDAVGTVELKCR